MLLHRLALRLGRTLRELEATMDEEEFRSWFVFDLIEPIGDIRHDLLAGSVCATLAARAGVKSSPSDHTPKWDAFLDRPDPVDLDEQNRAVLMALMNHPLHRAP